MRGYAQFKGPLEAGGSLIYLIGVEHRVQSIAVNAAEFPDQSKYRAVLEHAIRDHNLKIVAEEYSQDALKSASLFAPKEFFTKRIADEFNARHLLCDTPFNYKYKDLGFQGIDGWIEQLDQLKVKPSTGKIEVLARALEVVKDIPLRENYWLKQLDESLKEDFVFVCGDYHVDTFGKLLASKKICHTVVERGIGVPESMADENNAVRTYAEQNAKSIEDVYSQILVMNKGKIPPPESVRPYLK
jgi:hypothetical protein